MSDAEGIVDQTIPGLEKSSTASLETPKTEVDQLQA